MTKEEHDQIVRGLVDSGKLVEAGFLAFRITVIPEDASTQQIEDMRASFFLGAQHVFSSMLGMFEGGSEPTDKDVDRMRLINNELNSFLGDLKKKYPSVSSKLILS